MFDSFKAAAKNMGASMVDTHVRPAIQSKASNELTTLRSHTSTLLPDLLKELLVSKLETLPAFSSLSSLILNRLDPFLNSFTSGFNPIFHRATDHLDTRVTDVAIEKIKVKMHLIPETESEDSTIMELRGQWPEITSTGWQKSLHTRIRRVNEHVLAHIVQQLPHLFQQHFRDTVLSNVRGDTSSSSSSSPSSMLSGLFHQFVQGQTSVLDQVPNQLWSHVQSPVIDGLIKLLGEFENGVLGAISKEILKVPGLSF